MENILLILTYIAVTASAISGALEARKHEMATAFQTSSEETQSYMPPVLSLARGSLSSS